VKTTRALDAPYSLMSGESVWFNLRDKFHKPPLLRRIIGCQYVFVSARKALLVEELQQIRYCVYRKDDEKRHMDAMRRFSTFLLFFTISAASCDHHADIAAWMKGKRYLLVWLKCCLLGASTQLVLALFD